LVARNHPPILFVDIDGVLNPFAGPCPQEFVEINLLPDDEEPVRICAAHADWLAELSESFDLMWATAWNEEERRLLKTVLDYPDFVAAASMPPKPFRPGQRVDSIRDLALNRCAAWIDDIITHEARAWASGRREATLLLEADPSVGVTRRQVDELTEWAFNLRNF
jgi:hypothetical protein